MLKYNDDENTFFDDEAMDRMHMDVDAGDLIYNEDIEDDIEENTEASYLGTPGNPQMMTSAGRVQKRYGTDAYTAPPTKTNANVKYLPPPTHRQAPPAAAAPTVAPVEYPFYTPTMFLPNWVRDGKNDLAYAGGEYTPFPEAKNQANVSEVDKITLFFDIRLYKELQILWDIAAKTTGEIAWFMLLHRLNPLSKHWLAWGYFLPGQEATSAEVQLEGSEMTRYFEWLNTEYEHKHVFGGDVNRHWAHGHKHPIAGWSSTDMGQQTDRDKLGYKSDANFFYVQTPGNVPRCDLAIYEPAPFRVENVRLGLFTPNGADVEVTSTRKKAIKAMVADLVRKPAPVVSPYRSRYNTGYNYQSPYFTGLFNEDYDYNRLDPAAQAAQPAWKRAWRPGPVVPPRKVPAKGYDPQTGALLRDIPGHAANAQAKPGRTGTLTEQLLDMFKDYFLDNCHPNQRIPTDQELVATYDGMSDLLVEAEPAMETSCIYPAEEAACVRMLAAAGIAFKYHGLLQGPVKAQAQLFTTLMDRVSEMLMFFTDDCNDLSDMVVDALITQGAFANLDLSMVWDFEDLIAVLDDDMDSLP